MMGCYAALSGRVMLLFFLQCFIEVYSQLGGDGHLVVCSLHTLSQKPVMNSNHACCATHEHHYYDYEVYARFIGQSDNKIENKVKHTRESLYQQNRSFKLYARGAAPLRAHV